MRAGINLVQWYSAVFDPEHASVATPTATDLAFYTRISEQLTRCVQGFQILSRLSWPNRVREAFLADWQSGHKRLPQVSYPSVDMSAEKHALEAIINQLDEADPVAHYLAQTAHSYHLAAQILEASGRPELSRHSIALYGQPGDPLPGAAAGMSNLRAAEYFAATATACMSCPEGDIPEISAETVQIQLQQGIAEILKEDPVQVELDPELVSKAAAGARRIRLRTYASFRPSDVQQLLQHEAFVHSLTAINGGYQPYLKVMALSAPRTTGTQEGLATFAELVTGAIDVARLKRISLRIIAIDKALQGADFIEIFSMFLDNGQRETEAFNSAMRVFRGAPLEGGSAFTKDTVYLHGLLSVHTFFRWCLSHGRLDRCFHLFAGRMTVRDVLDLEPFFANGLIHAPRYLPPWMQDRHSLAAYLAFSVFANHIQLHQDLDQDLSSDPVVAPRLNSRSEPAP